jgi:hypothetical protein
LRIAEGGLRIENRETENLMKQMEEHIMKKIFMFITIAAVFTAGAAVYAAPAEVPKTGQLTSYGTGTIDDGGLQRGVAWPSPRFTVGTGAEVDCVTDNLTGLMWVKTPDSTSRQWQAALDYADVLTLCGYSDWRLPNRKELRSLANFGQTNLATWLNTQGFSNVQADGYWSSSTYAANTPGAWNVNMGMSVGYVTADVKTDNYYVWPVRGGQ